MRSVSPSLAGRSLLAVLGAGLPIGFAVASCGTDAVGVEACRQIEDAHCAAAPRCKPGFDVEACKRFYRDQCLHGIENPLDGGAIADQTVNACVAAIEATAECAKQGVMIMTDCPAAPMIPGEEDRVPCDVIGPSGRPDILAACAFVTAPPTEDAGTGVDGSDDAGDGGEDADAGDLDGSADDAG